MGLDHAEVEPLLGEPASDGAHALDLGVVAPEAGFIGDLIELWKNVREADFLSDSQKKRASAKRARRTRWWPARTSPCESLARLMTARKCGASSPPRFSTAKYFWWPRITVISISSGVRGTRIEAAFDDVRKLVQIAHKLQQVGIGMDMEAGAFDVAG